MVELYYLRNGHLGEKHATKDLETTLCGINCKPWDNRLGRVEEPGRRDSTFCSECGKIKRKLEAEEKEKEEKQAA